MQGCKFLKRVDGVEVWVDEKTGQFVATINSKTRRFGRLKDVEKSIALLRTGIDVIQIQRSSFHGKPVAFQFTIIGKNKDGYLEQNGHKLSTWEKYVPFDQELWDKIQDLRRRWDEMETSLYNEFQDLLKDLQTFQAPEEWESRGI